MKELTIAITFSDHLYTGDKVKLFPAYPAMGVDEKWHSMLRAMDVYNRSTIVAKYTSSPNIPDRYYLMVQRISSNRIPKRHILSYYPV